MDYLEVQFALRRRGWTMRSLSLSQGRSSEALRMGLMRGTRCAMEAVARVLGMKPEDIWPSRYPARPKGGRR